MENQNEAFLKRLLETFAQEADEHIDNLSNGLLELEKSTDPQEAGERIEYLFREIHSLKGASRSVNISEIEEVCKVMENVFSIYKQSFEIMPKPLIESMLESTDLLSLLAGSDETARREYKPQVQEMIRRLKAGLEQNTVNSEAASKTASDNSTAPDDTNVRPPKQEPRKEATPPSPTSNSADKKHAPPKKEESLNSETIRIPVKKLSAIMHQTEELLFAKMVSKRHVHGMNMLLNEIRRLAKEFEGKKIATEVKDTKALHPLLGGLGNLESRLLKEIKQSKGDSREINLMVDRLLGEMKQALMLPFSALFSTLPKAVHDMARSVGKEAQLEVVGGEVEIDRRILEEMKDPLIHLMRNAVDHGIESLKTREEKNKPREGHINLTLRQQSASKVEITVRDDGGGINAEKVLQSAIQKGIIEQESATELDEQGILGLLFRSGVSTSEIVTDLSGRGLGLAIVQEKAEQLGGQVTVKNLETGGSEFSILLPLTMATFRGVLTSVNDRMFIFPSEHIARVMEIAPDLFKDIESRRMVTIDHEVIPFYHLHHILETASPSEQSETVSVVLIESGSDKLAIGVDTILYEEEVMVKSLGKQLVKVRNISGAALLASEKPALILNISDLFKSTGSVATRVSTAEPAQPKRKRKVMVVDDSPTTRILLQNIMEMAGYDVRAASDGLEAFETLKKESVDLVVSDIQMPRMDGFELTESIRGDHELEELPVVLVTSLESPEDKERGMKAGANAYIIKSTFDQNNLMENIRWLID